MGHTDGPKGAQEFHGHLLHNADANFSLPIFTELSESVDPEALHLAVKKLKIQIPLRQWVPVVHYGLLSSS
jgi:hypothetical protein